MAVVRGKVLFNGQPLANVRVEFYPESDTGDRYLVSRATTAADGTYELICDDDRKGAVLGVHRVVVKPIRPDSNSNPFEPEPQNNPYAPPAKSGPNLSPYMSSVTTRERQEVKAGENNIELKLTL